MPYSDFNECGSVIKPGIRLNVEVGNLEVVIVMCVDGLLAFKFAVQFVKIN